MKTLSWLTTGIAFSGFLVGVAHAAPPAPQARWTIMVYMSGDNNLEDFIVKDIEEELGLAGSDANIQIVALADRGPGYDTSRGDWRTTKLYHVTQGIVADAYAEHLPQKVATPPAPSTAPGASDPRPSTGTARKRSKRSAGRSRATGRTTTAPSAEKDPAPGTSASD